MAKLGPQKLAVDYKKHRLRADILQYNNLGQHAAWKRFQSFFVTVTVLNMKKHSLPLVKFLFSSYACQIWIFIFDTDHV